MDENTKLISVSVRSITHLRVDEKFTIKNVDDDTIRSLLVNTMPEKEYDELLLITDLTTGDIVLFDQEKL